VATRRVTLAAVSLALILGLCSGPVLAFPEETPGVLHASLLKGIAVDPADGAFSVGGLQAAYLPEAPQGAYSAHSDDPARKLWALLSTPDGVQVARLDFEAEKGPPPMWTMTANTVTIPGQEGEGQAIKLAPGDYLLDFHLAAGKFYSFPFTVRLEGGKHLVSGAWNTWGYLLYANRDPESPLIWKVWLRRHEAGNREGVATRIDLVREKDGKTIATSRPDTKQWLTDAWVRYEFDLIHPMQGTSGGAFMKAADLLAEDGSYALKMSIDGAPYGIWVVQVADGKFRLAGRADRETATPLAYVYGGSDAFWYETKAAAQVDAGGMAPQERTFAQKGMIPDCKPIAVGGTTLVPIGPVLRFLEAQSQWDAATKTFSVKHDDRTLALTVGKATAQANGAPLALGAAPIQRDGETYAPVRPLAEALGAQLTWDAEKKLLMVIDGDRAGMIHVP
jgi:hypothetical protein